MTQFQTHSHRYDRSSWLIRYSNFVLFYRALQNGSSSSKHNKKGYELWHHERRNRMHSYPHTESVRLNAPRAVCSEVNKFLFIFKWQGWGNLSSFETRTLEMQIKTIIPFSRQPVVVVVFKATASWRVRLRHDLAELIVSSIFVLTRPVAVGLPKIMTPSDDNAHVIAVRAN